MPAWIQLPTWRNHVLQIHETPVLGIYEQNVMVGHRGLKKIEAVFQQATETVKQDIQPPLPALTKPRRKPPLAHGPQ
jgi:hypothetical protein